MARFRLTALGLALALFMLTLGGCSTAPKAQDMAAFRERSKSTLNWFKGSVKDLDRQLSASSAYIVFPDVAKWGILFSGGEFGRGILYSSDGQERGWAAINVGSLGLQVGAKGFRLLLVLQNERVLSDFKENKLTGSVSGVVVVGEAAATTTAPFTHGVALYQGADTGVMAGVNVGLNYIRYRPMAAH